MVYRGSPTPAIVGCFLTGGGKPVTIGATSSPTRWVSRVETKRSPRAYALTIASIATRCVLIAGPPPWGSGWCGDGRLIGQKVAYT
jgi:hypothetical protein